jgi:pentatricopeptide repeat protein
MKPGRTHWNALLHAYAESRKYDGAIKAYRRMTDGAGITPDSYTLVAVLTAAARAKAGPAAASWALATAQSYAVPMSLPLASALLNCCRQSPVPELESTGVNDGTNSSTSSGTTSRTTAKTPTTTRQTTFSTSMVLVAEIRAAMRAARIEPNIAVFNTLLASHAHAGDWEGVKATLKDLEESEDVEPNENTWGIALAAFQKAGWWQDVEGVEALRDTWRTLHGERGA